MNRVYQWLLKAYPRSFRRRFGVGMSYAFEHQRREAAERGRLSLAAFWLRSAFHALLYGTAERLAETRCSSGSPVPFHRPRGEPMHDLSQDFRLALRRLAKSPAFTVAAILTLGLGIGATTAIFSVVEGVVLRPLPYPAADRLVTLWHSAPGAEIPRLGISQGVFQHYRTHSRALDAIAAYDPVPVNLTGEGEPLRILSARVTSSFFDLLLAGAPAQGRVLGREDDQPGAAPVALLSHRLWLDHFGADPTAVGRSIELDGTVHRVIGVLPPGFRFPSPETEIWTALRLDPSRARLGGFNLLALGRMRPGATKAEVQGELQRLIPRLSEPYPGGAYELIVEGGRLTAHVTGLKEHLVGDVERMLWILLGTVGCVLLIACANVANLFLVRAAARRREMAVRAALGASRGRIVRGFLAESITLGLLGGGGGLFLAQGGVRALVHLGPASLPRLEEIGVNTTVLAFTAALGLLSGLAFGVLPAFGRRASGLAPDLKAGGRASTSAGRYGGRDLLVVSQVALALVLLVAAGLMARSFHQLKGVDPGFEPAGRLTFRLSLPPGSEFPDSLAAARFHQRILDALTALPGVRKVGAVDCPPLSACGNINPLSIEAQAHDRTPPAVEIRGVTEGYFEAMGIPLLAGRTVDRADHEEKTGVAIVSRSLAERRWPGQNPLGRRIYPSVDDSPAWYTVVGVVGDVHAADLMTAPEEIVYFPLVGNGGEFWGSHSLAYVVWVEGEPLALAAAVRDAIWRLSPHLPVADLRALEGVVAWAQAPTAFAMVLLAIAAVMALALGVVGIYGVLSYVVSQRRREIGVRMALGARAADVRRLILRHGVGMAAVGLALGLGGALAQTRLMASLLFETAPADPVILFAGTAALFLATLVAAYLPARRASRQNPAEVLSADV